MPQYVTINNNRHVVQECCKCKTIFTMPEGMYIVAWAQADKFSFYCPHGHAQHYKSTDTLAEEEDVRRERDRLRQQIAMKDDEIAAAKREASAAKGRVTRLKNRAKAGLCPCCNRHFTNLERHMTSKHADKQAPGQVAG